MTNIYELVPDKCLGCSNTELVFVIEETKYFNEGVLKSDKGVTNASVKCLVCGWKKSFNEEQIIKELLK